MGFRMNISVEDPNNLGETREYGDDHKLYGYFAYEDVKNSFNYIHKFIHEQDDILSDELYADPKECYDMLCCLPYVGPIKLRNKEFKEFAKLYLEDVKKNKSENCYKYVSSYMSDIISCEKSWYIFLEWH